MHLVRPASSSNPVTCIGELWAIQESVALGLESLEESPQAVRDSAPGGIPEGSVDLGLSDLAPGLPGAQRGSL